MNSIIYTDRLTLIQPSLNDVKELFGLMKDESITHFLTWEPHSDEKTTETVVRSLIEAQINDKAYHWCIWLNDKIIGLVSLIDVRRKIRTWTLNRAELSYWIGANFQGKGYATEASIAILDFGLNKLNLHKVIIAHSAVNTQSKSICKKLGFIQYANEHDAFQKYDQWHDLIWYELIKNKDEIK